MIHKTTDMLKISITIFNHSMQWQRINAGEGKWSPHVATEAKYLQCKYSTLTSQKTKKLQFVATGRFSPAHP